jgi:hypothetical protein
LTCPRGCSGGTPIWRRRGSWSHGRAWHAVCFDQVQDDHDLSYRYVYTANLAVKRSCVETVGGFDAVSRPNGTPLKTRPSPMP